MFSRGLKIPKMFFFCSNKVKPRSGDIPAGMEVARHEIDKGQPLPDAAPARLERL
jgi:hypothetical protein